MRRKVTITEADNGFVLEWKEKLEDDTVRDVFECIQDIKGEKATRTELLHFINDHFGTRETQYDGFSRENLSITWNQVGDEVD